MSLKTLILSSSGLKNLVSNVEQKEEFKFIFGQHQISMKNVFAEFISPTVSKLHQADPTINYICFNDKFDDINLTKSSISKFRLLSNGETVTINEEESIEMKIISVLVDNEELFNKLNDLFSSEINETNIDHYLSNLTFFTQLSPSFKHFNYNSIVDSISKYFYLVDKEKLKKVPKPILYSIICNSNLTLENEDSLLDFLNSFLNDKEENICFYEEIEYSMLSKNKFEEFIDDFDSSLMTRNLWLKLKHKFFKDKKNHIDEVNGYRYTAYQTEYGIIEYLTKEFGGNVHDKGVVNVTASSEIYSYFPKNAVDIHNKNNYFCSEDRKDTWLKYDFIDRKVYPICYSITTKHNSDNCHPRNWVIEGSNDDNKWVILDNKENDESLNGISVTRTFDIKSCKESYRFLRMRQTGQNSTKCDYLKISSLEFFGHFTDD